MKCPFCAADETTVADTRINDDGDIVRRRRRCLSCDKRFTTYERAEIRLPQVVKKNGSRVDFDRDKLSASLWLSLRKRPVTTELVDAAIFQNFVSCWVFTYSTDFSVTILTNEMCVAHITSLSYAIYTTYPKHREVLQSPSS
jgi:transcriptional regulator NrdR family protein